MDRLESSLELFQKLCSLDLLARSPFMWWPNYGSFEVVIGAILTQNSRWEKVAHSLENLRKNDLLEFESFLNIDFETLKRLIGPSGLYNQKAQRLIALANAIKNDFGSFENFCEGLDRDWLLDQKGIGFETADTILCYACKKAFMVVDSYTARLLARLGWEFDDYHEIQAWLEEGMQSHTKHPLHEAYALFHGMIVENAKRKVL